MVGGMPIPELIAGWHRFRSGRYEQQRELLERIARDGQRPRVLLIGCCDSRADPAIVFDCDPGDLFVVRNVANLVPPCEVGGAYHGTSAGVEFAVTVLGVEHIVVLGHSRCGGIASLLAGPPNTPEPLRFVGPWLEIGREARLAALAPPGLSQDERANLCERLAIRLSLRNLETFPAVKRRLEAGTLRMHGWHYDLAQGTLTVLDAATQRFVPVGTPGTQ
jgi:carbonic anhydrase